MCCAKFVGQCKRKVHSKTRKTRNDQYNDTYTKYCIIMCLCPQIEKDVGDGFICTSYKHHLDRHSSVSESTVHLCLQL